MKLWLLFALLLSGCYSTAEKVSPVNFVPLGKSAAPSEDNLIEVMSTPPSRKYEELGVMSVQGKEEYVELTNRLKEKAASIGADALIGLELGTVSVEKKQHYMTIGNDPDAHRPRYKMVNHNQVKAVAIKYLD